MLRWMQKQATALILIGPLTALLLVVLSGCGDSPPVFVETDLVTATSDAIGPYQVRAVVIDDRGVAEVTLKVAEEGQVFRSLHMRREEGDVWLGYLPVLPRASTVQYYMVARDILDQETREPAGAPEIVMGFRMIAPALEDDGAPPFGGGGQGGGGGDGGGGAGGGGGGGGGGGEGACKASVEYPRHGVTLDPREDDSDADTDGLQTTVRGTTDADDGVEVTLVVGGGSTQTAKVVGGLIKFENVTLPVGEVTLEMRVAAPVPCSAKSSIGVLDEGGEAECAADGDCGGGGAVCFRGNCIGLTACETLDDCAAGMLCHQNACIQPQDLPSDACSDDEDCPPGLLCVFQLCAPETCRDTEDCLADEQCFMGECLTDDLPAPDSCRVDDDCGGGANQCLVGLCIPRQCFDDADCAGGDNCFSGFCIGFELPVGTCDEDGECPAGQECFLNQVCLPEFIARILPDSCQDASDCDGGADENTCLFGLCFRADCQVKADCEGGQDCLFGFCVPDDLPPPLPGTCGGGLPDCPNGSTCLFSICVPDAIPIPRPCGPGGSCPSERQQCLLGLFCFGF
jgi:hypothetical protein